MRFVVTRDLQESPLLKKIILFFLFNLSIYFFLQPRLEKESLGASATDLSNKILGNEELFIPPMSFDQLVELLHIDLFLRIIASVCLLAIVFRLTTNKKNLLIVAALLNLSILFNAISPIAIYFGYTSFAWIKLCAYWTQHMLFCFILAHCFFKILFSRKRSTDANYH
ncbi:MAG: hypothetical protein H6623_09045 [Bdellovibrionaceae bacterium]|nr:hypothetical protein [Pseudobdellovibrionaceae bacterium]